MKHRLNILEGCPDLLYQACDIAVKMLKPKKCYLITADTRYAQACLPPVSDEPKEDISEWKEEAMDDEDNWIDVKADCSAQINLAGSKREPVRRLCTPPFFILRTRRK